MSQPAGTDSPVGAAPAPETPPARADSPTSGTPGHPGPIVFFDGVCGLCNTAVDFLLRVDTRHVLRFAPLQGETAGAHLQRPADAPVDTIVLLDRNGRHERSDAVLRIAGHLGGFWRVAGLSWLVPRPLRDALYNWIARNRYAWFGQKAVCRLPTPAERARFLP